MKKKLYLGLGVLAAFVLWTVLVCLVDVQAIGPQGSSVGFGGMNGFAHSLTGVHWSLYTITDWLGLVPIAMMLGFALLGLIQWIRRKRLLLVDRSLLVLGGFYIAVAAAFLFFEIVVVNTRPVLIGGVLEASYPSSTTMLSMCVVPTAMMQLRERMRTGYVRRILLLVLGAFAALMVVLRLISGVHWLSDILGGALLSVGLVTIYAALTDQKR